MTNTTETTETKDINITITKLDKHALLIMGLDKSAFIEVNDLAQFGFTSDVVDDMITYEIFPELYKLNGKVVVIRVDIFMAVNVLLKRSMTLYKAVDAKDQLAKELAEKALPVDELNKKIEEAKENGFNTTESVEEYLKD